MDVLVATLACLYGAVGVVVAGLFCYDKTRRPATLMACVWLAILFWPALVAIYFIERIKYD